MSTDCACSSASQDQLPHSAIALEMSPSLQNRDVPCLVAKEGVKQGEYPGLAGQTEGARRATGVWPAKLAASGRVGSEVGG